MSELIPRRGFLATSALAIVSGSSGVAGEDQARTRTFVLKETAGLRRFGYPVHAILPPDLAGPKFRLEKNGRPVPAQFRKVEGQGDKVEFALDFNASPGPLDKETYTVRAGAEVEAVLVPEGGTRVERVDGSLIVSSGSALGFKADPLGPQDSSRAVTGPMSGLAFKVADPFGPFLRSVRNGKIEFVAGSRGFGLSDGNGNFGFLARRVDESFSGAITRQGPMAVGLRFESDTILARRSVHSVVDMTFPNSKSWIEVVWTIDDPRDQVTRLTIGTGLKLDGSPILVDLGANNTVYSQLRQWERIRLRAGSAPRSPVPDAPWEISKGAGRSLDASFARAASKNSPPAEGWAHIMDNSRCTAVAVADFGRSTRDEIECSSPGGLTLTRYFADVDGGSGISIKSIRFWLHFVTMPVQVGAVTSPQAMLAPLSVEWT